MVEFLSKYSQEQILNIVASAGFRLYSGFRKGTSFYTQSDEDGVSYVVHTYDHDYSYSKDYDDEYITINDYEIKSYYSESVLTNQKYWRFMYKQHGEAYIKKTIAYFTKKGDVESVNYLVSLLAGTKPKQRDEETDEIEID